jgi:O-antigen ligase
VFAAILFANSDSIISSFRQNRYDSNARGAGIEEQTRSITNISNDQSNGERLNRWKCAIRMFEMKPWTGFGPGTYQFQYLPLQRKSDMTRISVTNPYHIKIGQGGTAHSEYLLALSEGGIFLFLFFIFTAGVAVFTAMKNYYRLRDEKNRLISGALLVGMVTYLVHGLFNNFLDTDKAAFLFWGAISMVVTLHVYEKERMKNEFNQHG